MESFAPDNFSVRVRRSIVPPRLDTNTQRLTPVGADKRSVFFTIFNLMHTGLDFFSTMLTGSSETRTITDDMDQTENEVSNSPQPKKGAKTSRKRGNTRLPGRPHKRLQADVLQARTVVLQKKLQVLVAKKTLIGDRLEAYELEVQLRDKETHE